MGALQVLGEMAPKACRRCRHPGRGGMVASCRLGTGDAGGLRRPDDDIKDELDDVPMCVTVTYLSC